MTNNGVCVLLVFIKEVVSSRECNLIDVFVNLFLGHADTTVAHGQCAFILVDANVYGQVASLFLQLALAGKSLQLLRGIDSIAHNLTDKDVMVTIEKLFDDGEDVLGRNPDVALLSHNIIILLKFHE